MIGRDEVVVGWSDARGESAPSTGPALGASALTDTDGPAGATGAIGGAFRVGDWEQSGPRHGGGTGACGRPSSSPPETEWRSVAGDSLTMMTWSPHPACAFWGVAQATATSRKAARQPPNREWLENRIVTQIERGSPETVLVERALNNN